MQLGDDILIPNDFRFGSGICEQMADMHSALCHEILQSHADSSYAIGIIYLINMMIASFKGAEVLVEIIAPTMVKGSKQYDSLSKMDAKFSWGVKGGKEMEKYNDRIKFIEEWNYYDYHPQRWKWVRWLALIPAFKNRLNGRIVHLAF